MTNKIIVYTSDYCTFCVQAKKLLQSKGLDFDELNIQHDENLRSALIPIKLSLFSVKLFLSPIISTL